MANDRNKSDYGGLRFAGVGLEFAGAVVGLTLLGYWIDTKLGSEPWGLLIGVFVGIVGGTYNLLREVLGETRRVDKQTRDEEAGPAEKVPGSPDPEGE